MSGTDAAKRLLAEADTKTAAAERLLTVARDELVRLNVAMLRKDARADPAAPATQLEVLRSTACSSRFD